MKGTVFSVEKFGLSACFVFSSGDYCFAFQVQSVGVCLSVLSLISWIQICLVSPLSLFLDSIVVCGHL